MTSNSPDQLPGIDPGRLGRRTRRMWIAVVVAAVTSIA